MEKSEALIENMGPIRASWELTCASCFTGRHKYKGNKIMLQQCEENTAKKASTVSIR
jgi:hypothetical protein